MKLTIVILASDGNWVNESLFHCFDFCMMTNVMFPLLYTAVIVHELAENMTNMIEYKYKRVQTMMRLMLLD